MIVFNLQVELKEILGNSVDARALYSILHEKHLPEENVQSKSKGKVRNKFKYTKK